MDSTDLRGLVAACAAFALVGCATTDDKPSQALAGAIAQDAKPATREPGATAAPAASPSVAGTRTVYLNGGFEAPSPGRGEIEAWHFTEHAGVHSYDVDVDTQVKHGGKQSARMTNVGSQPFGALYQTLLAGDLVGRTVELSAWLRTAAANGDGAQLTLTANRDGAILAHKFLNDPGVTGTRDWQRYSVRLLVPKSAKTVDFGAMLVGQGTMWIDDVSVRIVN